MTPNSPNSPQEAQANEKHCANHLTFIASCISCVDAKVGLSTNNSKTELREQIDEVTLDVEKGMPHKAGTEYIMALIESAKATAVEEAEDRVLKVADSPCECGRDHKATPVRSVTGAITSYCQFSRVVPSELSNPLEQPSMESGDEME